MRCAGRDDGQTSHALQSQVNAETAATLFTIAHSQKIFTSWFLISGDAMHPILLKTRTNPAPFPNKARGRVKPTALSSHPKHRKDWYKSLAGVFAAPVCLAHLAANPADGYLTSEGWRWVALRVCRRKHTV